MKYSCILAVLFFIAMQPSHAETVSKNSALKIMTALKGAGTEALETESGLDYEISDLLCQAKSGEKTSYTCQFNDMVAGEDITADADKSEHLMQALQDAKIQHWDDMVSLSKLYCNSHKSTCTYEE